MSEKPDEKEKKSDFSIRNTFKKWLDLQKQQLEDAVFIFGNVSSGKTTLGLLLQRIVDGIIDPKLQFGKKKQLEYEGQINSRSTKPLTIYPKLFKLQNSNLNIIQVPSRIYQLEAKKRPSLDKLLNMVGLVNAAKKGSFVFLVQQKNTAGKFDVWKKIFQSILDGFKTQFLKKENFKSMAFVINKSTSGIEVEAYINRMLALEKLFQQDVRSNQYLQFMNSIESNKNLRKLVKVTSWDEVKQQADQIRKLSQFLKNIPKVRFFDQTGRTKQNYLQDQQFELVGEQVTLFDQFNNSLKQIIKLFKSILEKVLNSKQNDANLRRYLNQELKDFIQETYKHAISEDQKGTISWSEKVSIKFKQLKAISMDHQGFYQSIIGKTHLSMQYMRITKEQNKKNILKQFLELMAFYGLVLSLEDKQITQKLEYFYLRIIQYSFFEQRFSSRIKNLNYSTIFKEQGVSSMFEGQNLNKIKAMFMQKQFSPNQSPQNAAKIIQILDQLFPDSQIEGKPWQKQKNFLKEMLQLKKYNAKQPQKYIPILYRKLDQIINVKKLQNTLAKKDFSKSLALLTAQMLKNYNRPDLSADIFFKCGRYYSAMSSYEKILSYQQCPDRKQIVPIYIQTLLKMRLEQKAIECCYRFSQTYGENDPKLRQQLLGKLKQIIQIKKTGRQFSKEQQQEFLNKKSELIQYYIDKTLLEKIGKLLK